MPKSQLIYTDNPGSLPATYTIPPSLDLVVQAVVARINGAAASGVFLPTLEVLSSDDRLIARVRPDQEFAVGDTGVVTWSPFLRRAAAAATAGLPSALMVVTAPITTTLNPATTPNFDTTTSFTTNDASLFSVPGGAGDISIDVAEGGKYVYSISCKIFLNAARLNNGPFPGERTFWFGFSTGFFDAQWLFYYFSDADRQMRTTANYDVYLHVTGTLDITAAFSGFPFLQAMPALAAALTDGVACHVQITRLGDATP